MRDIEEALDRLVAGESLADIVDALIQERRTCRYVGAPKRRKHRGRTYTVRKRVCTGRPDPKRSRQAKRASNKGSARTKRKMAQKKRWRR